MVISSCSLAEARLLLDNFLKASIDKVGQLLSSGRWGGRVGAVVTASLPSPSRGEVHRQAWLLTHHLQARASCFTPIP